MSKHEITTVAARRKLKPRREPYWRAEGEGHIGFRCTGTDGAGTWLGRRRVSGAYAFQPLGRFDDFRDAQAAFRTWAGGAVAAERAGVEIGALSATVADAAENYLQYKIKTRGADSDSVAVVRSFIERFITGRPAKGKRAAIPPNRLAAIRLADLTERDIIGFRSFLIQGRDAADVPRAELNSASRNFASFKAMLNKAAADRLTANDAAWKNVFDFGDNTATSEDSHRYLSRDERARIIARTPEGDARNVVKLLCMIGARPVELFRATVGDYDKRTQLLRLWSFKGKSAKKRERFVPVAALGEALPVLLAQLKNKLPAAPLFDYSYDKLKNDLSKMLDELKIEDASSYCFRHSFITDCVVGGVPILEIAKITGTSVAMIEKTYGKLLTESVQRNFAKLKFA